MRGPAKWAIELSGCGVAGASVVESWGEPSSWLANGPLFTVSSGPDNSQLPGVPNKNTNRFLRAPPSGPQLSVIIYQRSLSKYGHIVG